MNGRLTPRSNEQYTAKPATNGRDANRRFTKSNPEGPASIFARQVAQLRSLLLRKLTPEYMETIRDKLLEMALNGNLVAPVAHHPISQWH